MSRGPETTMVPEFSLHTRVLVQGVQAKLFLNFCSSSLVGMPVNASGAEVSEEHINSRGVANLQIPLDVCSWRKAPAAETYRLGYVVDVVFHPFVLLKAKDDAFCKHNAAFRPHVLDLGMRTVEKYLPSVRIQRQGVANVKGKRYSFGVGKKGSEVVPYTELHSALLESEAEALEEARQEEARAKAREEAAAAARASASPSDGGDGLGLSGSPLIEEVGVKQPAKPAPAVKRGFLNAAAKAGKGIYGPEGSGEGVLPENAGDPVGYLPKGLRQKAKIVDCTKPEFAQQQQQATQRTDQQEMFKEITKVTEKYMSKHDRWASDVPDPDGLDGMD